jgi:hypothetical protein
LVEHVTENHGVGGSIPPLGTITFYPSSVGSSIPKLIPDGALWSAMLNLRNRSPGTVVAIANIRGGILQRANTLDRIGQMNL